MNRAALASALILALASALPAAAQDRPAGPPEREATGRGSLRGYANPSAVIAAELALDRDAGARGEQLALSAAAAPQAVVFTPRLVWAQASMKNRAAALPARRWNPTAVWSSCDGALVLARSDWTGPGGPGWLARIWQRQPGGAYKWLVTLSGTGGLQQAEPDMIAAQVADCPPARRRPDDDDDEARGRHKPKPPKPSKALPTLDPLHHSGASPDGSLRWDGRVEAGDAPHLVVSWRKDGADNVLFDRQVAAGPR